MQLAEAMRRSLVVALTILLSPLAVRAQESRPAASAGTAPSVGTDAAVSRPEAVELLRQRASRRRTVGTALALPGLALVAAGVVLFASIDDAHECTDAEVLFTAEACVADAEATATSQMLAAMTVLSGAGLLVTGLVLHLAASSYEGRADRLERWRARVWLAPTLGGAMVGVQL